MSHFHVTDESIQFGFLLLSVLISVKVIVSVKLNLLWWATDLFTLVFMNGKMWAV